MANFSRNGKAQDSGTAEQEVVGSMMDYVQHILNKQQETTNSIKKQLAKRVAEAKWGNPARNPIEVRKEGWLQKQTPGTLPELMLPRRLMIWQSCLPISSKIMPSWACLAIRSPLRLKGS
jgi:hypothetical protein